MAAIEIDNTPDHLTTSKGVIRERVPCNESKETNSKGLRNGFWDSELTPSEDEHLSRVLVVLENKEVERELVKPFGRVIKGVSLR